MVHKRKIFISHSWDYGSDYYKVEEWIDNQYGKDGWQNMSVPSHDAKQVINDKELEQMIDNNIKHSGGIIILAGMYAHGNYSRWIDKEIDIALNNKKTIIGIKPRGNERIPEKISNNADIMINWNSKSLIDAIEEYF